MKRNFYLVAICAIALCAFYGCKKSSDANPAPTPSTPTVPILTTTATSGTTSSSTQTGGTISSDGGATITARGVCWLENATPTVANAKTTDGSGTGSFTSTMSNLNSHTGYSVRAYATNSAGTGYGNELYVLTSNGVPAVTTQPVSETNHKWYSGGTNMYDGGGTITDKGVCWASTPNPTIANLKTSNGSGFFSYTSSVTFSINTTYYIRAYAINSYGTGYGNQVTYTTGVSIGLSYGGGIIFNVDASGQHGLIAAPADLGSNIPWAPGALFTTTTNAVSLSDGAANTTKIISVYGNSGTYAAKLCRDYTGGGFTDWFLPASDQAFILQGYQDAVGGFNPYVFLGTFNYWSSTENNNFRAWDLNFNYFNSYNNPQKNQLDYVRPIRAF